MVVERLLTFSCSFSFLADSRCCEEDLQLAVAGSSVAAVLAAFDDGASWLSSAGACGAAAAVSSAGGDGAGVLVLFLIPVLF